jgi:hypothetical protein
MQDPLRPVEPREQDVRELETEQLPYEPPQVQSVKLSTEAAEALT